MLEFKNYMESFDKIISIPVGKLYGWNPKAKEAAQEVSDGKLSHSSGQPIIVSKLDNPKGCYFIIDGYHRAIEAIRSGLQNVFVVVDSYVPKIERTGGAFETHIAQKVQMITFRDEKI